MKLKNNGRARLFGQLVWNELALNVITLNVIPLIVFQSTALWRPFLRRVSASVSYVVIERTSTVKGESER